MAASDEPPEDSAARLRAHLLATERAVPRAGFGRLLRTGRGAAGLALATVGRRARGAAELDDAELERIARLVAELGELKGVAMKAGQLLSYIDVTLPPALRAQLSALTTASPALPFASIEATARRALGERAEALLARMDRAPLAAASIGQVHRAELPDGGEVAVKVRHEGIEAALRGEFEVAQRGAALARFIAPGGASVRGFVDEAREALLAECDYELEASAQETFGRLFAADPIVRVPEVVRPYVAREVLTTRYLPGRSLDALLAQDPPQGARDRLGRALFAFYVETLYRHGLFHADPHPGNYAFPRDGSLVVYDFGCVRSFDRDAVRGLAMAARAVRSNDSAAIARAMEALGAKVPAEGPAAESARRLLRGFFGPVLASGKRRVDPGAALEAREVLRDKLALLSLELPGRLLFLLRLRFGLYAVLARLGAENDWAALEAEWAEEASP